MNIDNAASAIDGGVLLRKLRRFVDQLQKHVTPVFRYDEREQLDLEGSAVLGFIADRYYLITAAHVLDACDSGVCVARLSGEILPLSGTAILTKRPSGASRAHDQIDIGFIRLTEEEIDTLGRDCFLNLLHTSGPPMADSTTIVLALGYPVRDRVRYVKDLAIDTPLTSFMTGHANGRGYALAEVDPKSHILLRYRSRDIITGNAKGAPPDFHGISGGGVWPVSVYDEPDPDHLPLFAGIITERPLKNAQSLLVTRSSLILAFIERNDR